MIDKVCNTFNLNIVETFELEINEFLYFSEYIEAKAAQQAAEIKKRYKQKR